MRHALLLIITLSLGCSINHRSEQFACQSERDCGPGQSCTDNFCVGGTPTPTDGPDQPDPDGVKPDSFSCPSPCTSCNQATNTCTVDCDQSPVTCASAITCPAGFNCNILCTRNEGCQTINCTQGDSCTIQCKGNNTCRNVMCGPGACDIECTGGMSCRNIACNDSCACDVSCGNNALCLTIDCPGQATGDCTQLGQLDRCTSAPDGCNTCQ